MNMRHGHFMGYGYNGAFILAIILIITIVILILLVSNRKREINPQVKGILEILQERYVKDEINADQYKERKLNIEDECSTDPTMLTLLESYAKGEIDTMEYIKKRDALQNTGINKALNILNQRYAKGEISEEEYKRIKKDIL